MMNDLITARKKLTNQEIIEAITFLDEVGKLNDKELLNRGMMVGDAQKVNHFLTAVGHGESTCLPKQAATLLRLTPLLIKSGSNTVHVVVLRAMPRVIDAYQKATDIAERRSLAQAIKTAGMVCVSKQLKPTTRENREQELSMIEPFVGQAPAYREAKIRFFKRNKALGEVVARGISGQSVNAVHIIRPDRHYYRE